MYNIAHSHIEIVLAEINDTKCTSKKSFDTAATNSSSALHADLPIKLTRLIKKQQTPDLQASS
jgi:hypothetical protein